MRKYKYLIILVLVLSLIYVGYLSLSRFVGKNQWTPSMAEPKATLFSEIKWGFMGIGLHKADEKEEYDFDSGFTNFCIRNNKIYIADTVKSELTVFENNKLIMSYRYPPDIFIKDLGLTVSNNFSFIFAQGGYLSKLDLKTGEYALRKLALSSADSKILVKNWYTIYMLDDVIVLNDSLYMNKCFATQDLSEVPCPFKSRRDASNKSLFIYLKDGYYAGIKSGSDVWLYNANDKIIGRVMGIDRDKLLYDMRRSYQIDLDGVYYVGHTDSGVKIYFKAWQR